MTRSQVTCTMRLLGVIAAVFGITEAAMADTIKLTLRSIGHDPTATQVLVKSTQEEEWDLDLTAVIVCDVWDNHHCLNAVRRLEEFAPRLNQVLKVARSRGAIVIHAPSDCMPTYVDHPARQRALQTPQAANLPIDVQHWCSRLKNESPVYLIDQSDGGEDDDPKEHAEWAAKLKAMGRDPGTPWQKQSDLISIDGERDYISDRGDEVWNILEQHGIKNVILTGVHCNMCVLGRPFGLRQMVRNGKHVVLMRDMTDSMYSPKSWPYVDHFIGNDLVIDYVEHSICPTITSDQFLGGEPFRWKADQRDPKKWLGPLMGFPREEFPLDLSKNWASLGTIQLADMVKNSKTPLWCRGALRVPEKWLSSGPLKLCHCGDGKLQIWVNGHELQPSADRDAMKNIEFAVPAEHLAVNDYNLVVLKLHGPSSKTHSNCLGSGINMSVLNSQCSMGIEDRGWQVRTGDDLNYTNIPLPAKFGIGPNAVLRTNEDDSF